MATETRNILEIVSFQESTKNYCLLWQPFEDASRVNRRWNEEALPRHSLGVGEDMMKYEICVALEDRLEYGQRLEAKE